MKKSASSRNLRRQILVLSTVFACAAPKDRGLVELLESAVRFFPSPLDLPAKDAGVSTRASLSPKRGPVDTPEIPRDDVGCDEIHRTTTHDKLGYRVVKSNGRCFGRAMGV